MLYPDLSKAKRISFDIETYDPNLKAKGPGVYRKDGYVLGVSLSDGEGFAEYFNLGHYDVAPDEKQRNLAYLKDVLGTSVQKVGKNIIYDIDWLENFLGIKVNGPLADSEIAEALLDENQGRYTMDFLAEKYFGKGEGKHKTEIDDFCESNHLRGDPRVWLWKMPSNLVRKYAIQDANLPLRILDVQMPMLHDQELAELFELESELIRCLLHFRRTGVKIDTDRRDRNALKIQSMIEELQQKLFKQYGEFNVKSTKQCAEVLDSLHIAYPRTDMGNPSIDAHFLKRYQEDFPVVKMIYDIRRAKHHLDGFLMGSYVDYVTSDGLIHCSFYNMRNDEYGTRSGRFSSANPNLQQQPSKSYDEFWGQICREVFIPFDDCWWGKADYSQIEYRFMAHFAVGPGSEELRQTYCSQEDVDYHQYIMDLTGLKRKLAKNLNFGIAFGMGAKHMAELYGWSMEYCYEVLDIYHRKAPYVKATISAVESAAKRRGYIKTFLKRRSRLVDPRKAYIMYCRLVQGSAADLMKKAMLESYRAGIYDTLFPHATVHDEIDVSVPKTKAGLEAFKEMQHIMESCLTIRVPIKAELEIGPTWADVKEFKWEELEAQV